MSILYAEKSRGEQVDEEKLAKLKEARAKWTEGMDVRMKKEIEFATLYTTLYRHGTDGHNRLLLIAQLAAIIDGLIAEVK